MMIPPPPQYGAMVYPPPECLCFHQRGTTQFGSNVFQDNVLTDDRCPLHSSDARLRHLWATALLIETHRMTAPWWRRVLARLGLTG